VLPWSEASWLKKLVYALPPTLLRGHRVAATTGFLIVLCDAGLDVVPLGTPMQELAPGLYVPVGFEIAPRAAPEVLAKTAGAGVERLVFFTRKSAAPVSVDAAAFAPLERRTLARITVEPAKLDPRVGAAPDPVEPELVAKPVGAFALWGFHTGNGDPET
jgi:hypothetical protein